MGTTLLKKVWDLHTVRQLPTGQTQLFIGLHLVHEVTSPQAFDELLRDRFIMGSPEECADEVQRCIDETGANTMIFRVTWPGMHQEGILNSLRLLVEGVRPRLRSSQRSSQ